MFDISQVQVCAFLGLAHVQAEVPATGSCGILCGTRLPDQQQSLMLSAFFQRLGGAI